MSNKVQIIPAVLEISEEEYHQKIKKADNLNLFPNNWVQIDFADNKFVQNKTVGLDVVAKYPTSLKKEAHLMVENPEEWLEDLAHLGFRRVIFHLEVGRTEELIKKVKDLRMEVGIAINMETEVGKLKPFIATIDVVLVMSIRPGFGGQEFIPEAVERVRQVTQFRSKNENLLIEVDGGINEFNAQDLKEAGADILVIGISRLRKDGHDTQTFTKLQQSLA